MVNNKFSFKKNIIVIIIAALLALGVGGTAVALGISNMSANRVSRYMGAAERYLSEQNYEQAVIEFQRILEIEPMNVDAYLGMAEAYIALGDKDKAAEILNKGLDKTGDDRLKTRLEALLPLPVQTDETSEPSSESSSSVSEPEEPETPSPLTGTELSWLVDPVYEFDDVIPIRPGGYSDLVIIGGLDTREYNFPSYSYAEEYYQINIGDEFKVFYVPDRILSPFSNSPYYDLGFELFDKIGIAGTNADMEEASVFPWKGKLLTGGVGGLGSMGLIWDSFTGRGYIYSDFEREIEMEPVTANRLKKHHSIQNHDLGSLGDMLLDGHIEYRSNWLYNDEFISPVYEPVSPKYALWSPEDKLLTDFIYDEMCTTSYGITAACRDGKWGYLDENGAEITEFIYDAPWVVGRTYDSGTREYLPQYGAFPCTSDTMVVSLNGQYGLLYKDGRTLIDFGQFEDLAPAWNDQLWAKENGKWGLVDLDAAKQSFGI